jgi:PhnB protein
VWIGDSIAMMFEAKEDWPDTPSFINLNVEDCNKVHQAALDAGATTVTELSTNAWGDRGSRIRDPFGNIWWIQTHAEDVSKEEMARRLSEGPYIQDMVESTETLDSAMKKIRSGE